MLTIIICALIAIATLIWWHTNRKHSFWSSRGVVGPKPQLLMGNLLQRLGTPPDQLESDWFARYGKVYGIYNGHTPVLTVADPELIKQIMVKDFPQWMNQRETSVYHEIWSEGLFVLESEKWKTIRTIVTPTFSSSKLRNMNHITKKCFKKLENYLEQITNNKDGSAVLAVKEAITGVAIDVIASTMFATETGANDPTDHNNYFVKHALNLFQLPKLRLFALLALPVRVNEILGFRHMFPEEPFRFFCNVTQSIIEQRRTAGDKGKGKYADAIQLMLDASINEAELKNIDYNQLSAGEGKQDTDHQDNEGTSTKDGSTRRKLTDNEIIAQCLVFLMAGFETGSAAINFALFELAHHPEVQERLHRELAEVLEGKPVDTDEYFQAVLNEAPYLEAVIKETLRKYPSIVRLDRILVADNYTLGGIELKRNQQVEVPLMAVHWNPEYYPRPEQWDPERFMPENKHKLVPYTYLPFGVGPRNCLGMRFAYQEVKLCLASVLTKFRLQTTPTTPTKLEFIPGPPILTYNSFPLNIVRRENL